MCGRSFYVNSRNKKIGMSRVRAKLWNVLTRVVSSYYRAFYKMDIGKNVVIARTAQLDTNINPKGIHIGDNTWILANAEILAHDYCQGNNGRGKRFDTFIGKNCVIGINSIVLPGVTIGNHCVIGAGSIVTKDIPDHSLAVGNPAKVIKNGIEVSDRGQIINKGIGA